MDKALIIGNLCTLFAMAFNSLSATRKTPRGILLTQNMSQVVYGISAIVLGGYSAAVQNVVSILRNFTAIRSKQNKFVEWLLVALGVVLGIAFNNRGWIGLLPVIGNLEYTLAIFRHKEDERKIKLAFLISLAAFAVFNATIRNYVGVVSDTIAVITTGIMLIKSKKA
jgi:hypothetical protein